MACDRIAGGWRHAFRLADLGFGCPELGYFSLNEISQVRLPFGLRVERDIGFGGIVPLSKWAETARAAGSIIHAQALIRAIAEKDGPAPAGDKPSE